MLPKPVLDERAISRGQCALRIAGCNLDPRETRPMADVVQVGTEPGDALEVRYLCDGVEARALGDDFQSRAEPGMAELHARLAIVTVVENGNRQIEGLLDGDRQQAAKTHQCLAVTGDDNNRPLRLS